MLTTIGELQEALRERDAEIVRIHRERGTNNVWRTVLSPAREGYRTAVGTCDGTGFTIAESVNAAIQNWDRERG